MMKKNWAEPMIEGIELNDTAYNMFEGNVVDGVYVDQNCKEQDAYES